MNEAIINPLGVIGREKGAANEYQIFVLRMWGEGNNGTRTVRLSVENTDTGQRSGFTDWEKMMQFLRHQMQATG